MNCNSKLSPFLIFLVSLVLSVLLRFTDSDNTFGILKLLFYIHRLLFRLLIHLKDVVCLLTQDVLCLLTHDVLYLFTQDVTILRNWHSCQWLKYGFVIAWPAHENTIFYLISTKQCCGPFLKVRYVATYVVCTIILVLAPTHFSLTWG
jgi:hypothetical protein